MLVKGMEAKVELFSKPVNLGTSNSNVKVKECGHESKSPEKLWQILEDAR